MAHADRPTGPTVVLHEDAEGGYRFNVIERDGTVLASSMRFDTPHDARAGFERTRSALAEADLVDQSGDGADSPSVTLRPDVG